VHTGSTDVPWFAPGRDGKARLENRGRRNLAGRVDTYTRWGRSRRLESGAHHETWGSAFASSHSQTNSVTVESDEPRIIGWKHVDDSPTQSHEMIDFGSHVGARDVDCCGAGHDVTVATARPSTAIRMWDDRSR
jgi:hypothetical protein